MSPLRSHLPAADRVRPLIYQLMPRSFGNTRETPVVNGSLAENGCGKFSDISTAALSAIRELGITHLWLTGVLEQASGTAYPDRPADVADILKGVAGSPYAIRDYFDVSPDYAQDPPRRLAEFVELLERCHAQGLRVLIDLVPNHVARSYDSDVCPELSFGVGDDRRAFFARDNHFYYLQAGDPGGGPPLKLPTVGQPGCSGGYAPEREYGRVTGNNVISWAPGPSDWYETVKLNYGHDFTTGRDTSHLPGPDAALAAVPKTWRTMDQIVAYWQGLGVDGFRVDMAHLVPMPFWRWLVKRARERHTGVFFCSEAYDNDPAKLTDGQVLDELLEAGFDAVYDDPAYDVLEGIYDAGKWANDLDHLIFTGERFHKSLRYAENHDEVRLANPQVWGGLGMQVGKSVCAVLFGLGRGPLMIYQGQEVGEPALGVKGYCGDNARSSIFDYGSLPELLKWVNGGQFDGASLSPEQKGLRAWYAKLLGVIQQPAFIAGGFYGLNFANRDNPHFGRLDGDSVSGHWLYAFLRHDAVTGQAFLVVANFHGSATLCQARLRIPLDAMEMLSRAAVGSWTFADRLVSGWTGKVAGAELECEGLGLPDMSPCTALMLEIG
ncbi:MAG: alpha-amylase [Verrucomicrobia bacterium]|nr:MAG: alpha-amylase [Verrucomicrobiota bacterium]